MSAPSLAIQEACQVLRGRVMLKNASVRLPTTQFPNCDTVAIREALRPYVLSWIIPIIDAIERGDTKMLREMSALERHYEIGAPWDAKKGGES